MRNQIVLGIDIGGSHISVAPVDLQKKQILSKHFVRIDFDSNKNRKEIIELWVKTITQVSKDCAIQNLKIGIAFPGPFDYENGICYIKNQNKYEDFYNLNVRTALAEGLHIKEQHIFFLNDAASFLKGELFINSNNPYKRPLGIVLGTGMGSAKILLDAAIDAGLWCTPFRNGIAEDYLSTKWFLKKYESITERKISSVKKLAAQAKSDNQYERDISLSIFAEFGENLARVIAIVFPMLIPDIMILGGNIGKSLDLFQPSFNITLGRYGYALDIHLSNLGEDAAIMGAASLCVTLEPESELMLEK